MSGTNALRAISLAAALAASLVAAWTFYDFVTSTPYLDLFDFVRALLFLVAGFWILWGGAAAVIGIFVPRHSRPTGTSPPSGRTIILVPVYNEDAVTTFARIAAMNRSILALGLGEQFHFAVLSDSGRPEAIGSEALWFQRLATEPSAEGRLFYRRRERNIGRKAGNIEDFIVHSGAAYDYALVLDADSLMDGATIAEMARRLDDNPKLALLQSLPVIIGARSLFGRSMQFASNYLSPWFARGATVLHGAEGPYWGHNAIFRVKAFAACCGLPTLPGKAPQGGHILSHDFVEAALLARGGWKVELDPFLGGSYEEGPDNLIEYAKRDRRWCQGNLQHAHLLAVSGIRPWSRFTLLQGIMAYLASPLWLGILALSIVSAILPRTARELGHTAAGVWVLAAAVFLALLLPKMLIVLRHALRPMRTAPRGSLYSLFSVLAEIVLSTLFAPILLLLQTQAVIQFVLGRDGGWPATSRNASRVALGTAFAVTWWICLIGAATLIATAALAAPIVPWVLPVTLPAVLAPFLVSWTSLPATGESGRWLFLTAPEVAPEPIVADYHVTVARWTNSEASEDMPETVEGAQHVHA